MGFSVTYYIVHLTTVPIFRVYGTKRFVKQLLPYKPFFIYLIHLFVLLNPNSSDSDELEQHISLGVVLDAYSHTHCHTRHRQ